NDRRSQWLWQKHAAQDHRRPSNSLVRDGEGPRPDRYRTSVRRRDGVSTSGPPEVADHPRQRDAADRNVAFAEGGEWETSPRPLEIGGADRLSSLLSCSAFGRHAATCRHLPRIDP